MMKKNVINLNSQEYEDEVILNLGIDYKIKSEGTLIKLVKKKRPLVSSYNLPITFEDCCYVLGISADNTLCYGNINDGVSISFQYDHSLISWLENLRKLKICRDAYWKIADNWIPDWDSLDPKYSIYNYRGNIKADYFTVCDRSFLVFPEEAMRDEFYKNFKELIENYLL